MPLPHQNGFKILKKHSKTLKNTQKYLSVLLSRVRIETEINVDNLPKFNKTEITSGE